MQGAPSKRSRHESPGSDSPDRESTGSLSPGGAGSSGHSHSSVLERSGALPATLPGLPESTVPTAGGAETSGRPTPVLPPLVYLPWLAHAGAAPLNAALPPLRAPPSADDASLLAAHQTLRALLEARLRDPATGADASQQATMAALLQPLQASEALLHQPPPPAPPAPAAPAALPPHAHSAPAATPAPAVSFNAGPAQELPPPSIPPSAPITERSTLRSTARNSFFIPGSGRQDKSVRSARAATSQRCASDADATASQPQRRHSEPSPQKLSLTAAAAQRLTGLWRRALGSTNPRVAPHARASALGGAPGAAVVTRTDDEKAAPHRPSLKLPGSSKSSRRRSAELLGGAAVGPVVSWSRDGAGFSAASPQLHHVPSLVPGRATSLSGPPLQESSSFGVLCAVPPRTAAPRALRGAPSPSAPLAVGPHPARINAPYGSQGELCVNIPTSSHRGVDDLLETNFVTALRNSGLSMHASSKKEAQRVPTESDESGSSSSDSSDEGERVAPLAATSGDR